MFGDAFDYPLSGEDVPRRLLVGGGLSLGAAIVFLVALPVQGYLVAVLRRVGTGEETPPAFADWEALFVDGLKAWLVSIAYVAVPSIVLVVGVAALTGGFVVGFSGPTVTAASGLALLVGLAIAAVAVVVFTAGLYLLPVALAHFAVEDDLATALHVRTVAAISYNREYALAWLFVSTVVAALGVVAAALSLLLVGFVVSFYLQVVSFYLFARGYRSGRANVLGDDTGTTTTGPSPSGSG